MQNTMKMRILSGLGTAAAALMASLSAVQPLSAEENLGFIRDIEPYSVKMMMSEMARNPQASWLDGRNGSLKWNYTTGLELLSFLDVAERYDLDYAVDYVRRWADTMATEDGAVYKYSKEAYNLDHICPARIYYRLYDDFRDHKYRRVLRMIREQIDSQPRTSDGIFWHKQIYPHQVWLDGLYMAQPFYAEYTARFSPKAERDSLFHDIAGHFKGAAEHTYDSETGLFRHAWDESRSMFWADSLTGQSAHAWGRACGWYALALVETLDYFPEKHSDRAVLEEQFRYLMETVRRYADPETGMWFQVLDSPGREGNYLEATASAMFVYAALKGVRTGLLKGGDWRDYSREAYRRFISAFVRNNPDGTIYITSCCSVAGLGGKENRSGKYEYYLSEPVIDNDCKGVGPFIWASLEYEAANNVDYVYDGTCISDGKAVSVDFAEVPAFEGAEGGGMYTAGGRGGKVYTVTSLEDSEEEGTLRHAVRSEGPRIVKFAVSGDIHLKSTLKIEDPYITILGQTAPGQGITIRDHGVYIGTDEVIIRYLRFRMGSAAEDENDALGSRHNKNIIIDHCSISWATDENASFYANSNATIQWCIISEALNSSIHHKGEHGYGGIWGGRNVTFHHNLIAHNNSRNPRFDHPAIYDGTDLLFRRGTVEFVNNIVYNWGMKAIYGGEEGWFNIVGNLFKAGPGTKNLNGRYVELSTSESTSMIPGSYYIKDNIYDVSAVEDGNYLGKGPDEEEIAEYAAEYEAVSPETPFACRRQMMPGPVMKEAAAVLKSAGASHRRDDVDKRIVKEVRTGTATFSGSVTGIPGIIDSENDVRR